MNISTQEGSEYFRGLLLLVSKDRIITESEIMLMKRVGKALGFDQEFTVQAVETILDNSYIKSDPPTFASEEVSRRFIRDGLIIARSDNGIHKLEAEWLWKVAEHNGLTAEWFTREKETAIHSPKDLDTPLEINGLSPEA